jgi:hypothetical protein
MMRAVASQPLSTLEMNFTPGASAVGGQVGRRLGYATWGPKDGRPLVLHHGAPGSRLHRP